MHVVSFFHLPSAEAQNEISLNRIILLHVDFVTSIAYRITKLTLFKAQLGSKLSLEKIARTVPAYKVMVLFSYIGLH